MAERFEVAGFPTLKWFVNGKDIEYNGGRTAEDIIKWVTKKSGPAVADVSDVATLEKLQKVCEGVLVLCSTCQCCWARWMRTRMRPIACT